MRIATGTLITVITLSRDSETPSHLHIYMFCEINLMFAGKTKIKRTPLTKMRMERRWLLFLRSVAAFATTALFVAVITSSWGNDTSIAKNRLFLKSKKNLALWQPGMLDIHHLRVGPGVSSFIIMPDGTTMLIDAGDVDLPRKLPQLEKRGFVGLKIRPPFPNNSKTTAGWVLDYIQEFWPSRLDRPHFQLDYVLNTHFHSDHLGDPGPDSPLSKSGKFKLSGLTEVGDKIKIGTLIDRGYPDYQFPSDLLKFHQPLINYHTFLQEYQDKGLLNVERFVVGSTTQIKMQHNPKPNVHFLVRNLKSNLDIVSTDESNPVTTIPGTLFLNKKKEKYDENEMSTALVIEYGNFRYYEGGDQEQHSNEEGSMDTITPTAQAAGLVDVATANHHGRGTNQGFCDYLDPHTVIMQGLFSDQPLVETMEFLTQPRATTGEHRLLLVTDIYEEPLEAIGKMAEELAAMNGHVVVRVSEPTSTGKQTYAIFMLDEKREVKATFGPFHPRRQGPH